MDAPRARLYTLNKRGLRPLRFPASARPVPYVERGGSRCYSRVALASSRRRCHAGFTQDASEAMGSRAGSLRTVGGVIGALARSVTIGLLAGLLSGIVAGGLGSRVAMRIVALTAGSDMQGALTDAEAVVGKITLDGSVFLVLFGGFLFGSIGGLVYVGMRPWVADAGRWRGLVFGTLLLAMFGWVIVEGDNADFHLLGSPLVNIAMFASLFVLFGLLVAPVYDRIDRVLPTPSLRRRFGVLILPADYALTKIGSLGLHAFSLLVAAQVGAAVAYGFGDDDAAFIRTVGSTHCSCLSSRPRSSPAQPAGSGGCRTCASAQARWRRRWPCSCRPWPSAPPSRRGPSPTSSGRTCSERDGRALSSADGRGACGLR